MVAEPPGDVVSIPIRGTNEAPALEYFIFLRYAPDALRLEDVDLVRTPPKNRPNGRAWFQSWPETGLVEIAVVFDSLGRPENLLPPLAEELLATVRFRIRSSAGAGTYSLKVNQGSLVSEAVCPPGAGWSFERGTITACPVREGSVVIREPSGLLPPEIEYHRQDFRDITFTWQNPILYDSILVDRDGVPLAQLTGDAVSFFDRAPPTGVREYGLVGVRAGERSIRTVRRVLVGPPALPAPSDFACVSTARGCELSWKVEFPCDWIRLYRDGSLLATLSFDADRYIDTLRPVRPITYEIRAEREGALGEGARCTPDLGFSTRVGEAKAEPGARGVRVPVYASTMEPLQGMSIGLCCESRCVQVTGWTMEGTVSEAIGIDSFKWNLAGVGFIFDAFPPVGSTFLPPGVDQHVVSAIVDISIDAPPGSIARLRLCDTNGSPYVINVFVYEGRSLRGTLIDGDVAIGAPPLRAPGGLRASAVAGKSGDGVLLAWKNAGPYDRLTIEREGEMRVELPGSAETFIDEVSPGQVYHYKLRAYRAGARSMPAMTIFSTLFEGALFRRGDVDGDGRFLLGDAVRIIEYLSRHRDLSGCADAADANDDGKIGIEDAVLTLEWLFGIRESQLPPPGPHAAWIDPTADSLPCKG